jgi:hypothetical protein
MTIDERIERLEALMPHPTIPDTMISRVSMANSLVKGYGLIPDQERESTPIWCLALGAHAMPKVFFYGNTIEECLTRAEEAFSATEAAQ